MSLATVLSATAHPEIETALKELNPAIVRDPANAGLFLRRAVAYQRHGDLTIAEADLRRATELAPRSDEAWVCLAGFFIARERWAEARPALDRALDINPRSAEAFVWRARMQRKLAAPESAYLDFSRALALLSEPSPELYLERAGLPLDSEKILAGLDEGLARLGPVVGLSERAVELETSLGRTDAALTRLRALAATAERKERWLKRCGDLLAAAGRVQDARDSYVSALDEINRAPVWLRESTATSRLSLELHRLLQTLP